MCTRKENLGANEQQSWLRWPENWTIGKTVTLRNPTGISREPNGNLVTQTLECKRVAARWALHPPSSPKWNMDAQVLHWLKTNQGQVWHQRKWLWDIWHEVHCPIKKKGQVGLHLLSLNRGPTWAPKNPRFEKLKRLQSGENQNLKFCNKSFKILFVILTCCLLSFLSQWGTRNYFISL